MSIMYLLKIKGAGKLPDYVQIRGEDFKLIAFINLSGIERGLAKNNLEKYSDKILSTLNEIDFNEIKHIKEEN
jgi:hypothetical protein